MKRIDLPALLLGSLLTSLYAIPPTVAATMTEVSVFYQPPTSSAGRQPRTGSGGQLVTVPNSGFPLGGPLSGPSTSAPTNAEPTISVGTTTYNLAFISISGGAAGGITVFPGANIFSVAVPLQDPPQNILVENVYFPVSGSGPPCPPNTVCGSGANIDEFSETLGTLVDDTFVNVFTPPASPNPNVMVTKTANASGSVNTTNQSVRISAITPATQFENTPTGGNFDRSCANACAGMTSLPDAMERLYVLPKPDNLNSYRHGCQNDLQRATGLKPCTRSKSATMSTKRRCGLLPSTAST
ncbi:hypothetical protein [Bradyrhizobium sp.]|uniref:hypothetical protein n=1 Tax=Bradyrhizobium sp. TaxID=376 RepID=UPI003C1CDB21